MLFSSDSGSGSRGAIPCEEVLFSAEKNPSKLGFLEQQTPPEKHQRQICIGENSFSGESEPIPLRFFKTPGGGTGLGTGELSCPCCVGAAGWVQNIFIPREL